MPEFPSGRPDTPIVAVVGPTGSGKTRLAEDIAIHLGGAIVTADSMQIYRGMDIGTAKTPPLDRRVPHHMLDIVDPGEPYSAALYQEDARRIIDDLLASNTVPIVAGGTGLYVRAALDEMSFPSGEISSEERLVLEREAKEIGASALHDRLAQVDPRSAELIHPNNVRRTIRALEMSAEGISYADQAAGFSNRSPHYRTIYIGLDLDRESLYTRIDTRVDTMLENGLLDEVKALIEAGHREAITSSQAIGYKEFVPVVDKEIDIDTAIEDVKRASRRYAKRQLTWFRGDPRINWLDVTNLSPQDVTTRALTLLESSTPPLTHISIRRGDE